MSVQLLSHYPIQTYLFKQVVVGTLLIYLHLTYPSFTELLTHCETSFTNPDIRHYNVS